jgi:flagellar hook-basal body protein
MYKDTTAAGIILTRGADAGSWAIAHAVAALTTTDAVVDADLITNPAPVASVTINNISQMNKDTTAAGITLTRGADASTWTITGDGGYANMAIALGVAGTDDLVSIDLDGAGGADVTLTLTGTWAAADSIHFDILSSDGGYANMTMIDTGTDDQMSIDLDGAGGADVTFNLTNTWAANDTLTLAIVQTEVDTVDMDVRFHAAGSALPNGSTIGTDGVLNWNIAGDDAPSIRSFASTSRITSLSNDGYSSGTLTGLNVNETGVVEGMFSNGKRQNLARILLADFANSQGLNNIRSYFVASGESGDALINHPGSGGVGSLQSNSLEMSNTDVAAEFIKMITAQRAYQSCAKVITTSDQMLQQLMSIKQ